MPPLRALELVDELAPEPVLAYGSSGGRDLDLLARPDAELALREGLRAHGFIDLGRRLVRVGEHGSDVVELTPAADWRLASEELESLFAEASPIDGATLVVHPAPHHKLLILARSAIYERCPEDAIRVKSRRIVDSDPNAFELARKHSGGWAAGRALGVVERAARGGGAGRLTRARAAASRVRADGSGIPASLGEAVRVLRPRLFKRGTLITVSGLDGSGKSSLAVALRDLARDLDVEATVVWSSLSQHPRWLHALADLVRGILLRSRRGAQPGDGDRSPNTQKHQAAELRRRSHALTLVWSTIVTARLALALARVTWPRLLRGETVICDRYTLDSIVQLRYQYGSDHDYRLQRALLRLLTPDPELAYFLDLPPEVASGRKNDFSVAENRIRAELYRAGYEELGLERLDSELSPGELLKRVAPALFRAID
ncbi:MAG: dTMP kinase [Solirubrobacterales bacterium]